MTKGGNWFSYWALLRGEYISTREPFMVWKWPFKCLGTMEPRHLSVLCADWVDVCWNSVGPGSVQKLWYWNGCVNKKSEAREMEALSRTFSKSTHHCTWPFSFNGASYWWTRPELLCYLLISLYRSRWLKRKVDELWSVELNCFDTCLPPPKVPWTRNRRRVCFACMPYQVYCR